MTKKTDNEKLFKTVKKVSGVPFIKIEPHEPAFVRIDTPITQGMMKKKLANFAMVTDLLSGEPRKLLVNTVLAKILLEGYPNDTFIGLSFRIEKGEKVEGAENSYYEFEVSEIEPA